MRRAGPIHVPLSFGVNLLLTSTVKVTGYRASGRGDGSPGSSGDRCRAWSRWPECPPSTCAAPSGAHSRLTRDMFWLVLDLNSVLVFSWVKKENFMLF